MEVRVQDHYAGEHEPQTFRGSAMEVENQLRTYFKGAVGHIPFGDLYEMVSTLRRATGIDIWVSEMPPKIPKRVKELHAPVTDPWLHEIDLPKDDESNL